MTTTVTSTSTPEPESPSVSSDPPSDSPSSDDTATLTAPPPAPSRPKPTTDPQRKTKQLPLWHVVLHDDDDHSYDYVMRLLMSLFAKGFEQSFLMAKTVDTAGRVICDTTHKERAEFKCEQIIAFGADPTIPRCQGSMTATIEPAEFGDDDNDANNGARGDLGPA